MASKVVPVIMEGSTDGRSLFTMMELMVAADAELRELGIGGDLTLYQIHSQGFVNLNAADPFSAPRAAVVADMNRLHGYTPSDIAAIIQITDLDGAMIPDDRVLPGGSRLEYHADHIETPDVDGIRRRNRVKAGNIRRLSRPGAVITIKGRRIPYFLYYMSRNLEHVLHDDAGHLNPREKTRHSLAFERRYQHDPDGFLTFLSRDEILHGASDYPDSWRWPFEGTHSLERGSNLALMPAMLEEVMKATRKPKRPRKHKAD